MSSRDQRKENERTANEFDRQLFGLIETARQRSQRVDPHSNTWSTVLWHLVDARPSVRGMMSKQDLEATR